MVFSCYGWIFGHTQLLYIFLTDLSTVFRGQRTDCADNQRLLDNSGIFCYDNVIPKKHIGKEHEVLFCPLQLSCPFFTETYGYIRELWVASEYRRRGNGRRLPALAEQDLTNRETAQGTKIARVLLKADPRATGFFEKQGYTVSDTAVSEEGVMYTKHISR